MTCDASVIVAAKALEDGRQEGIQEGFQNGHLQGKEEGRQEEREALILRKHQDGKSPESIAESLYLPVSYVTNILKEHQLLS